MTTEHILVIDDEKAILDLCRMILSSRGYEVRTAASGMEGLRLIAEQPPSLVLLDYMMPVMDGMSVLKQIRQDYPDVYVIMFTGKGSETVAVEVMKAGASDYVLKPFNNHDLLDRIDSVLKFRRIELINRSLEQERAQLQQEIQAWNRELEMRVAEKTRELEQAHNEIVQAEKLATVGHLSAGMAHEIRNPLNSIGLFAQLLATGIDPGDELAEYPEKILKEIDRIDAILLKLLAASKQHKVDTQPVSLDEVIHDVADLFRPQFSQQGVDLDLYLQQVPKLVGDQDEFVQIFTNLFVNALQAMADGGLLSVEMEQQGDRIYVEVSDNGSGIAQENLSKVFDPFFTTKSKGTGFGLSVVLRIVKNYHGSIRVSSILGKGTSFYLEFPVHNSDITEKAAG
ncbi:response regulator [Desulfuromonas acetoxidans]|uniref:histidine kinase n=1 Tax=Desulfuromonas acetoxidans (strain DSM 684 / 11070) TaxID=281689 RepID=Q1K0Y7_DESA6|nr:response regulator [Desulfuromonas acetoxidans]EAT16221.1 response regulator receiver sensor signal transduction histidine kinase [Desulfuromonas acetoxidans DSM 684]MBF0645205.1 response regulator [Desulfuromonas acetoxidans]NVD23051.1 response regulator [Desulfuromonas acetoxidans]NVE15708.1 response regulator [Desulfuromonas acetoxidans]